jgi:hypothetical protein
MWGPLSTWYCGYACFIIIILRGMKLSPLGTAATTGLLYQSQMIDDGDCAAIGGIKISRGNQSTGTNLAPAPLCPPQILHDQTRARTHAAAVGIWQLTAWAMGRSICMLLAYVCAVDVSVYAMVLSKETFYGYFHWIFVHLISSYCVYANKYEFSFTFIICPFLKW